MTMQENNNPIGVFDSGLGGLTVVKELMRQLPAENIVYFGDTARVPYGTKSEEAIVRFSIENTKVLCAHKVKMVVVACNSSSSYAIKTLRAKFPVPVVGVIAPGAKKAVALSKRGKVGVIATSATVASRAYERALKVCDKSVKVYAKACPLFVPLAEEGWFRKPVTYRIAAEYCAPLRRKGIDALILGCTHYPLLKAALQKAVGKNVALIDSAKEVAAEVKRMLTASGMRKISVRNPKYQFLISDRPQEFKRIARNFLGRAITNIRKV